MNILFKRIKKDEIILSKFGVFLTRIGLWNYYKKYHNKNRRCCYPFSPEPLGYCWEYATRKDGGISQRKIIKECKDCKYWKEKK